MKSIVTIIAPPVHTNMTTQARVQSELGLTSSQAKARVPDLIIDSSALICNFCDRQFARATVQQKFPIIVYPYPLTLLAQPRVSYLRLLYIPVVSVASASYNGVPVDITALSFNPDTGDIYGIPYFDTITYTGGYLMPEDVGNTLPREVERACIDTVSMIWYRGGKGGRDPLVKMEAIEHVGTTSYFNQIGTAVDSLPPSAAAALERYQRINI